MTGQHAGTEPPVATPEQVLDELDFLSNVEHALVVEYLLIHCTLGHDVSTRNDTIDERITAAAQAALDASMQAMRRLRRINETLALAGRPPQLGRATAIVTADGAEIPLGRPGHNQHEHLTDREARISEAVDARYDRLRPAVEPSASVLDGDLLVAVDLIVATGVDHAETLHDFHSNLADVPPDQYLRVTRREPTSDTERTLQDLADRYYSLIVAAVRAELAHVDEFGGRLLQHAVSTMDGLNDIHRLLVTRGLLPLFTDRRREVFESGCI